MAPLRYSVEHLRQLWARGDTYQEIAAALGCKATTIDDLKRRHGLPNRGRRQGRPVADPTPEQIAERAAEVRTRRRMPEDAAARVEIRVVQWDGFGFSRLA